MRSDFSELNQRDMGLIGRGEYIYDSGFPVPSDRRFTQTGLKHEQEFIVSVNCKVKSIIRSRLSKCSKDLLGFYLSPLFGTIISELG